MGDHITGRMSTGNDKRWERYSGLLNPLPGRKGKTIQRGLFFQPVEFHGFKLRIVEMVL
jgi:hypothetical protein